MSEYQRFLQDKGELKRYDYDLNENSFVMDVGGYKGEFAENIFKKFGCHIHIFEPVFFENLKKKFKDVQGIFICPIGLSNKTRTIEISINEDSTSMYKEFPTKVLATFWDIKYYDEGERLNVVDLIKINIEGEEYNLLERIIETGIVTKFKNIQVQFHKFIPDCDARRDKIREELSKTHICEWEYEFIWESWRLK